MKPSKPKLAFTPLVALLSALASAQLVQTWHDEFNGTSSAIDRAYSCARDIHGNQFVTGTSTETGEGLDIVILKYTPSGTRTMIPYPGGAHSDDIGYASVTDNDGNLYVSGYVTDVDGGSHPHRVLVILKYDNSLNLVWDRKYNAGDGKNAVAVDIALDPSGKYVYACGYTATRTVQGVENQKKYLIIRYDSGGNLVSGWPRTFDGEGGTADSWAVALCLDTEMNCYVTGVTHDFPGNSVAETSWGTLKYNGAGTLVWVKYEDGARANKFNEPSDIKCDVNGTVYVCGYVRKTVNNVGRDDYRTVSYESGDGTTRWKDDYNNGLTVGGEDHATALAIQVTSAGVTEFIYVTGWAATGTGTQEDLDWTTLRYKDSSSGPNPPIGTRRESFEPNHLDDRPFGISCAGNGNIYITGDVLTSVTGGTKMNLATVMYNNALTPVGLIRYADSSAGSAAEHPAQLEQFHRVGRKNAVSGAGRVHVAGYTLATDMTIVDYQSQLYEQTANTLYSSVPSNSDWSINFGTPTSGSYLDLQDSDNSFVDVKIAISSGNPLVQVEVRSTCSTTTPSEFCLRFEGHSSLVFSQVVEFYDYVAAAWRTMDSRASTTSDSVILVSPGHDPKRYVSSGGAIKARISWYATGAIFNTNQHVFIDHVRWEALP